MKFIIGKKIEMTQKYDSKGNTVPLTVIEAGPCIITQIKDEKKDGYNAIQIGYGSKKRINKPLTGHLKGRGNFEFLREFREMGDSYKAGDTITVDTFDARDTVKVTGTSKGKGFQGVVKRHNFKGMPKSHGTKDQLRMPGSVGATGPAHVFKGQRMPGHTGNERVTISGLEIFEVDKEKNLLYIKGAVPGARNGIIVLQATGDLKVNTKQEKAEEKEQAEAPKAETSETAQVNTEEEKKSKESETSLVNEASVKDENKKEEEQKDKISEEKQ